MLLYLSSIFIECINNVLVMINLGLHEKAKILVSFEDF